MKYSEIEKIVKDLENEEFSMPIKLTENEEHYLYSNDVFLSKSSGKFCLSFVDKRRLNYRDKKFGLTSEEVLKLIKRKIS